MEVRAFSLTHPIAPHLLSAYTLPHPLHSHTGRIVIKESVSRPANGFYVDREDSSITSSSTRKRLTFHAKKMPLCQLPPALTSASRSATTAARSSWTSRTTRTSSADTIGPTVKLLGGQVHETLQIVCPVVAPRLPTTQVMATVSAGHTSHPSTTAAALDDVFR